MLLLILLVLGLKISDVSTQLTSTQDNITPTSSILVERSNVIDASQIKPTPTQVFSVNSTMPIINTTVSASIQGNVTSVPSMTNSIVSSTFSPSPTNVTKTAKVSSSPITSIQPATATSSIIVSSSAHVTPTHAANPVIYKCGEECKSLRKRLYTSAVFAILFLIVSIVLGILLYRQYQISKEYQNDPSLSRLI